MPPPRYEPQRARGGERRRRERHRDPERDVVGLDDPQAEHDGVSRDGTSAAAGDVERSARLCPRDEQRHAERDPGHEHEEEEQGKGGDLREAEESGVGVAVSMFFFLKKAKKKHEKRR